MYKRILVAIDGSATSSRGLAEAIRLAQDQHARLRIFHAVDDSPLACDWTGFGAGMLESLGEDGSRLVSRAGELAAAQKVNVESRIACTGKRSVADTILEDARDWGADLIVMGTHGRRGFSGVMLGSDAEAVLHGSAVPVLMVRSGSPEAPPMPA